MTTFTTGKVAKICQVSPRVVNKWFDKGLLPGYRVPGSRDRRVTRVQLITFCHENQIPIDCITKVAPNIVLLFSPCTTLARHLQAQLKPHRLELIHAPDAFSAGLTFATAVPQGIVLDLTGGVFRPTLEKMCDVIADRDQYFRFVIMTITHPDLTDDHINNVSITERFTYPFDSALLATRLATRLRATNL